MTRWARSGNTQKHKKMPGDATSWEELSTTAKMKSIPKGNNGIPIQRGRIEKKKHTLKRKFELGDSKRFVKEFDLHCSDTNKVKNLIKSESVNDNFSKNKCILNAHQEKKFKIDAEGEILVSGRTSSEENQQMAVPTSKDFKSFAAVNNTEKKSITKNQIKKAKRKMKLMELEILQSKNVDLDNQASRQGSARNKSSPVKDCISTDEKMDDEIINKLKNNIEMEKDNSVVSLDTETDKANDTTETKRLSKCQWKKARKRKKLEALKSTQAYMDRGSGFENQKEEKSTVSPPEKDFIGKKKLFLEQLQRKRQKNGITLLPSKVERKIYNIKKALRDKGLPADMIKTIARKERRKEELKFRKTFSTKPCFNCRETGHLLAECPLRLGNSNQATGICFKCGSTEHTSYKCQKKVEGYPLAKCFVCKEKGHISKDCPKNEHGVYPKGGKCSICGNVNHLRKDCPSLSKKNNDPVFTVHTISEGISVDAEITDAVTKPKKKTFNMRKVVKF